tara:strand:+ start:2555 stop:4006 length:1452 start_codon:yes stop_codon:yes gene_type:complete
MTLSFSLWATPAVTKPPSFILVLTDDQGWSSMSSSMDKRVPDAKSDFHVTPSLDQIVASGIRFSNAYAASPVCAPSRYSIQFGKSPARLLHTRVLGDNNVNHDQAAIPQVLKAVDPRYRAAHLGKWHIKADPARYGYDVHDGQTGNKEGGFVNDKSQWYGDSGDDPKKMFSLTDRAIEFMTESVKRDTPFFLQVSHYALHSNLAYRQTTFDQVSRQTPGSLHENVAYASMMTDLDESIGRLFDAYKRLGLNENTYFIVTSDNGGMPVLPQQVNRGRPYKNGLNAPLLRGKWDLMEGGIRVPFLAVGPDIKPNSQSNEPIIGYDLMATFAELAGSSQHVPEDSDGVSIVPLLGSPDAHLKRPPHGLVFHFPHYNQVGLNEPHSAIRVGNFKLVRFDQSMRSLLFNVATDLGEAHDLAESNAACVDKLEALLDTYLTAVGAEQPKDSSSWVKPGKKGKTKTRFLERYPVNVSTSYEGECLTDALI